MYHPARVAAAEAALVAAYPGLFPQGLIRSSVDDAHGLQRQLANAVNEKGQQIRALTAEEQHFLQHELCLIKIDYRYWDERYAYINREGQGLASMYPLWESQTLVLDRLAQVEQEHFASGNPDGVLANVLKARQLGVSTLAASLIAHRILMHRYITALIAGDVPEQSAYLFSMLERIYEHLPWWQKPPERFHVKNRELMFETHSRVTIESGKSMRGGLQEQGGAKGNLGRGKTYAMAHLSELSTWEHPEQLDDGLFPAIPRTARTLVLCESTAKGRHDWWHSHWQGSVRGVGRFVPIFIPWYAEPTKYWLPPPGDWVPLASTLTMARRAEVEGPRWLRKPSVTLSREQLFFYEQTRATYDDKGMLAKFLEEYACDPDECFQHAGRSVFTLAQRQRMQDQARPLARVFVIDRKADLMTVAFGTGVDAALPPPPHA